MPHPFLIGFCLGAVTTSVFWFVTIVTFAPKREAPEGYPCTHIRHRPRADWMGWECADCGEPL